MRVPAWVRQAAQITILLAALAVGGVAVADRWTEVRGRLDHVQPGWIVAAFGLIAIAEFATMMSWRALLADFGNRLSVGASARIVYLSALGKYLPGSVWPYLAQVQMGRRYDVPRTRSAAVSVLTVLLSLIMALLLAAAIMPWAAPGAAGRYWPVFLAVPVLVALLHPRVVRWVLATALRLARRPPSEDQVTFAGIAASAGWSTVNWVASGLQIWALGRSVGSLHGSDAVLCIGAYALAWSAGFLVVIDPAGAGVREAALTAALSTVMPTPAALTVALLSRAVTTAGDFGAALVGGARPGFRGAPPLPTGRG